MTTIPTHRHHRDRPARELSELPTEVAERPAGEGSATSTAPADSRIQRGTEDYSKLTWGLFAAGMATFIALYDSQALLPAFTTAFGIHPATAALAVSVATGAVAVAIIPASALSERFGRTPVMIGAAVISSVVGLLLPLAPNFPVLLAGRAVQGLALAGVPAVAMAYLAEEIHPASLGAAMGRYIAGNTVGGLVGRLIPESMLAATGWRWALAGGSLVAAAFTVVFLRGALPSRHFTAQPVNTRRLLSALRRHLSDPVLLCLFGLGFVLMGGFVSMYNYLGFRLTAAPFRLPQGVVGLVFLMYLAGTWSSAAAGRWADRFSRIRVLPAGILTAIAGLALTIPDRLWTVLPGMLLFTAGFFAAHAVASGWVGARASRDRAQASSLYLFAYYLGSAVAGAASGLLFVSGGWSALVAGVGALMAVGLALSLLAGGPLLRSTRQASASGPA